MSDYIDNWLFIVFVLACGALIGWWLAHSVVADECKRLGGFYVGSSVYECREKAK